MSDRKFGLTSQQKIWRGLIFIAAGIFLIIQVAVGDAASGFWVTVSWLAAFVAFGALMLFLWSMRQKQ
ncbi:MAG: hypothetical protein FOGNACKC_03522 [Anaerolineae bacterium]|nr:hypothetical protein [Anaerolineae bacterium]